MGDFNTPPAKTDRAYQLISEKYNDVWLLTGNTSQEGRTWPTNNPLLRVDYIWITDYWNIIANSTQLYGDSVVTNHLSLITELYIN